MFPIAEWDTVLVCAVWSGIDQVFFVDILGGLFL